MYHVGYMCYWLGSAVDLEMMSLWSSTCGNNGGDPGGSSPEFKVTAATVSAWVVFRGCFVNFLVFRLGFGGYAVWTTLICNPMVLNVNRICI